MTSASEHSISDEMLSAYLDGALEPDRRRSVERALSEDSALQHRLDDMRDNDRRLREHYDALAARPVPPAIAAMLEPRPQRQTEPARKDSLLGVLRRRLSEWRPTAVGLQATGAFAAIALVAVGVIGWLNAGDSLMTRSLPASSTAVATLLERQPSGAPAMLDGDLQAVVNMSFRHADGRFCRQYRVSGLETASAVAAVACRSEGGRWQSVLAQRVEGPVGSTEVYRAAGSDQASAIDAYIMEHMSGELLLGEGEAELIGRGWVEP